MKRMLLGALLASGCGSGATCAITVATASPESAAGQSMLTGDFTEGPPIMVLTFGGQPNFIACNRTTNSTATCNISGLVGLGTYILTFDVSCDNDAEDGTADNEAGDSFEVLY